MRGDKSRLLLGIVENGLELTADIFDAFFKHHRDSRILNPSDKEKHRVEIMLHKLKKDGCLEAIDQKWKVTKFGLAKLNRLIKQTSNKLPPNNYNSRKSKTVTIVTFDIPENERQRRDWLRSALSNLGFTMMHRSVWVGKIELPKIFIEDIKDLKIEKYLQILSLNNI